MKIALGMIIKSLDSDAILMNFISNAEKYGHKIDSVIVAYTHKLDAHAAQKLSEKIEFIAVNINDPGYSREQFRNRGISDKTTQTLLKCPIDTTAGQVPYGYNRNIVLIEALLREIDILFFVDSDVYPTTLKMTSEGPTGFDTDFFGAHLEYLNSGSEITTGEYSGYNILPPATFDGMEDLLEGVQKADMLEYWKTSESHRCLAVRPPKPEIVPCTKILGGNSAIKLRAFSRLPPFFSSHYTLDNELFLCRGEDTVLGIGIKKSGITCTDICNYPLHDTYKDYPKEPNLIGDPATQNRFYYACTGWVGRNPFLNYLLDKDLKITREYQREKLIPGLSALAQYTSNPRYDSVIRNFDASWNSLKRYIEEYEQILDAWAEFTERMEFK